MNVLMTHLIPILFLSVHIWMKTYSVLLTYVNNSNLSILLLNIQSLPDKFNEFSEMIRFFQTKNCSPDIVCLQELWEFPDHTLFIIPGYENLLYKLRRNNFQGGGVGIYSM